MAADSDTRLSRRVQRDIEERGRNLEAVLNEYMRFVKPAFDAFVYPVHNFPPFLLLITRLTTEHFPPFHKLYQLFSIRLLSI